MRKLRPASASSSAAERAPPEKSFVICRVFSFGGRHGFVTKNPVEKASVRKTDNRRERFLTLEEVSHLGEAFDKVETDWTHQAPMYSQPSHFHRRRFFRASTALGVPGGFGGG